MRQRLLVIIILLGLLTSPLVFADNHFVNQLPVQQFINHMVIKYHFNKADLTTLFSEVKIRPQVIQSVKKPLEKKASWQTYQMLFVDEWRIQRGVAFWDKHAAALKRAEAIYGVPAGIIVATIGIETRYGQKIGNYRVIDSLTNLAFSNSTRAPFFQHELEQFLLLTREEKLDPRKIMGSYAGAMGQPQFMPSSYRYYAINFSNSGKIDLMHNEVDVIGSIANYYHHYKWDVEQPVIVPASVIGSRYDYLLKRREVSPFLTIAQFSKYGVLPKEKVAPDLRAQLIQLQNNYNKEYWLGFHNFMVIKRYNASDLYAMAVYQLSNYITSLRKQLNNG